MVQNEPSCRHEVTRSTRVPGGPAERLSRCFCPCCHPTGNGNLPVHAIIFHRSYPSSRPGSVHHIFWQLSSPLGFSKNKYAPDTNRRALFGLAFTVLSGVNTQHPQEETTFGPSSSPLKARVPDQALALSAWASFIPHDTYLVFALLYWAVYPLC